jgi:hypothetical protein
LQESLSLAQLMKQAFRASAMRHEVLPSDFAYANPPAKQTQTSRADSAHFISQPLANSHYLNRRLRLFTNHAPKRHEFARLRSIPTPNRSPLMLIV